MANLGVVYEVNTTKNEKNKYPVVYSNKTCYYCKQYGCDELRRFYKDRCISIKRYHSILEKDGDFYGAIFVDSNDDVQIPEVPRETILKIEIEDLEKKLTDEEYMLKYYQDKIQEMQKYIDNITLRIQENKKQINKRGKELLNLEKGHFNND